MVPLVECKFSFLSFCFRRAHLPFLHVNRSLIAFSWTSQTPESFELNIAYNLLSLIFCFDSNKWIQANMSPTPEWRLWFKSAFFILEHSRYLKTNICLVNDYVHQHAKHEKKLIAKGFIWKSKSRSKQMEQEHVCCHWKASCQINMHLNELPIRINTVF